MDVCQPKVSSLESVGEFKVIDAEEVENGRMQVVDMDLVLDGVEPEIIGPPVHHAWFDAAASHPDGVSMGVMIPADLVGLQGSLHHGRPAKFASPEHEGFVQQTSLLEVPDEGDGRLVGFETALLEVED